MVLSILFLLIIIILLSKIRIQISFKNGKTDVVLKLSILKLPVKKSGSRKPVFKNSEKKRILKAVLDIFEKLRKKAIIEKLKISCVQADPDPYVAVMRYNILNAVAGSALQFVEKRIKIREKSVYLDYSGRLQETETEIYFGISIRVVWLLHPGFHVGRVIFKILADRRSEQRSKRWKTNSAT